MLAPVFANDDSIELIENSGIQFIDKEFVQDSLSPQEGLCLEVSSQAPLIALERNEEGKIFDPSQNGVYYEDDVAGLKTVDNKETLAIYNGVWFPIPYFVENSQPGRDQDAGPFNWARCRVVRVNDPQRPNKRVYRAVFAFDTKIASQREIEYSTPLESDVQAGLCFKFRVQDGKEILKKRSTGHAWGKEWIARIYHDALSLNKSLEVSKNELEELMDERMDEAHYLNMLTMLKNLTAPPEIKLKSSSKNQLGVTLVLDIGNSRSCGILMEDEAGLKHTRLSLRDLNAPERVYQEAFESRVEFSVPNFDYYGFSTISGRVDAFTWPSIVRTGFEASNLAAMRKGNEGATGLSSPKRYIWNDEHLGNGEWCFSPYSYQIPYIDINTGRFANKERKFGKPDNAAPKKVADLNPVCDNLNGQGDALFACEKPSRMIEAAYSGKSIMTFMLIEIILQALSQINSYAYRFNTQDKNAPRYLKAVVITTPPSMPDVEREIFRGCAYEALGILWKCLAYDPNKDHPEEFKFVTAGTDKAPDFKTFKKQIPEVVFDWDEAEAAQIVYLFNETQEIFGGDCAHFLKFLRRHDAKGRFAEKSYEVKGDERRALISARIASIDIGGGTTDMVITDYSFPENTPEHSAVVRSREILREGFKLAGDDILRDIIEKTLLEQLANSINQAANAQGRERWGDKKALNEFFDQSNGNEEVRTKLQQATLQIFMKVGYRIMSYLERLNRAPLGTTDATLAGTVGDFILGRESCTCTQIRPFEEQSYAEPAKSVVCFVNDHFKKYLPDFDILEFKISADLVALNTAFLTKGSRIAPALASLSAVLNLYRPDLLLLTGRPSNISGIRTYFLSRCGLAGDRVISLSSYSCGSWYSFATDGSAIGDTKTTVAMGAAIAYMRRSSQAYRNFRFDLSMPLATSPVRYFGHINERLLLTDPFYRFVSQAELCRANNGDVDKIKAADAIKMFDIGQPLDENGEAQDVQDLHSIADNLGFRQFSYEGYPASMLYSIERITDIKNVKRLQISSNYGIIEVAQLEEMLGDTKNASQGVFQKLDDEQFAKCLEAKNNYVQAMADIRQTGEFVAFQNSVVEKYKAESLSLATAELKDEVPSGMFKALKQKSYEKKLRDRADEIYMQKQQAIEQELLAEEEDQKSRLMHTCMRSVSDALGEHYQKDYAKAQEQMENVKTLISSNIEFALTIGISGTSSQSSSKVEAPVARLEKLWKEISQDPRLKDANEKCLLPQTFRLELKKAVPENKHDNYSEFLKLKLKTVNASDENYWTDTGRIYDGAFISSGESVDR